MPQVCLSCQFVSNLANACANLKKSRQAPESASGRGQVLAGGWSVVRSCWNPAPVCGDSG